MFEDFYWQQTFLNATIIIAILVIVVVFQSQNRELQEELQEMKERVVKIEQPIEKEDY